MTYILLAGQSPLDLPLYGFLDPLFIVFIHLLFLGSCLSGTESACIIISKSMQVHAHVLHTCNSVYLCYHVYTFRLYCSVPGKRPWALYHNYLFFTTLGTYPVYWALTMCQIMHKTSGWSQRTIAIAMAIRSRSPLTSAPVSDFRQGSCSFVKHRSF